MVSEINHLAARWGLSIFLDFPNAVALDGDEHIALHLAGFRLHKRSTADISVYDWDFQVLFLTNCKRN
jgi:hypothetical protein